MFMLKLGVSYYTRLYVSEMYFVHREINYYNRSFPTSLYKRRQKCSIIELWRRTPL